MQSSKLIAIVTAALLTLASVGAINYNVPVQPVATMDAQLSNVTNLAPVHVYPSADELREIAAFAEDADTVVASTSRTDEDRASASFKLVGSALAMPHYSFGQKFGRISKD